MHQTEDVAAASAAPDAGATDISSDQALPEIESRSAIGASGGWGRIPWPLVGVLALLVLLAGAFLSFQVVYAGRIYPGVSALGVDLSGMNRAEATAALQPRLNALGNR